MTDPYLVSEVLGKDTEIEKSVEGVYSKFNVVGAHMEEPPPARYLCMMLAWRLHCSYAVNSQGVARSAILTGWYLCSCCMLRASPTSSHHALTVTGDWFEKG